MVENKTKLLAITHNFIGENYATRYGPALIELEDRVVILISGEELANQLNIRRGDLNYRTKTIELVRDPRIAEQQPNILLLYIGMSPMKEALEFAEMFVDSEIHLVFHEDTFPEVFKKVVRETGYCQLGIHHHLAEASGNITMASLVNNFIEFGSLK